jgi:F-type H+-transporting ATPase subunit delta
MKSNREIQRQARQLFRACLREGRLDEQLLRRVAVKVRTDRPRGAIPLLKHLTRLTRLELARRHAVIETAAETGASLRVRIVDALRQTHGADITAEFIVVPGLLGGLRVRLGNDVLDGSVRARLDQLTHALQA